MLRVCHVLQVGQQWGSSGVAVGCSGRYLLLLHELLLKHIMLLEQRLQLLLLLLPFELSTKKESAATHDSDQRRTQAHAHARTAKVHMRHASV